MNYDEFVDTYLGKAIDYDGASGVQCVDLTQLYIDKVIGQPGIIYANAKDYYNNYNQIAVLRDNFTRIANTPEFVPQKGDIVVFGSSVGNGYGHVCIATGEGNTHEFYSYDQNWGSKPMHEVLHLYRGILGVLRPDDQSKIEGAYRSHVQDIGWQGYVNEGEVSGTTGICKQIEAIQIALSDVEYRVHMMDKGWGEWHRNNEVAGTTGENRRIEAIEFRSNRQMAAQAHCMDIGWQEERVGTDIMIGTTGECRRMEAFRFKFI